ncbi:unnamed protein product, partial [marine sediment metagenome]
RIQGLIRLRVELERTAGELAVSQGKQGKPGQREVLLVSDLLPLPWYPAKQTHPWVAGILGTKEEKPGVTTWLLENARVRYLEAKSLLTFAT